MADVAIPVYGDDRDKHVLVYCLRAVALTGTLVMLGACGNSSPSEQESINESTRNDSALLSLLPMVAEQSSRESTAYTPAGPIRFPQDLRLHPDSGFESISVQAVVKLEGVHTSVQAEFDRLAVLRNPDHASAWSFPGIMRAGISSSSPHDSAIRTTEFIERQALALAGSTQDDMHVLGQRLQIDQGPATVSATPACDAQYRLDAHTETETSLTLIWRIRHCPPAERLASLNRWQTLATPGYLQRHGDSEHSGGWVWTTHAWGNLPSSSGAVVLDQLRLVLDEDSSRALQLTASRSKRKSGRGPKTILASAAHTPGTLESIEIQWDDEGQWLSPHTGLIYPQRYRVSSQTHGLDLLLTPLLADSERVDARGTRWNGAVLVSGSHSGVGFVEFQPAGDMKNL